MGVRRCAHVRRPPKGLDPIKRHRPTVAPRGAAQVESHTAPGGHVVAGGTPGERRHSNTHVVLPVGTDDAPLPSLLTLSDVMGTGHHAAVAANVGPGKTVAVVGDGAVGLCGVIAARRLGAEQVIILGCHPDRIALAREFGATHFVSERCEEAVERMRELTDGFGVHSVLECVGLAQSMLTALSIARPGGTVGRVGVPQDETVPASGPAFYNNVTVSGRTR